MLKSRHRPESVYKVDNLTQLLSVASKTANALTTVLLLISVLTLLVSGVGIMNIMLATVTSRIREIGVRKAVGATSHEIRAQFLAEAMMISLGGGIAGNRRRAGAAVLVALPDRLPHAGLRLVGDYRGAGFVDGRRAVWNSAGSARGAARSGGELAVRVARAQVSANDGRPFDYAQGRLWGDAASL